VNSKTYSEDSFFQNIAKKIRPGYIAAAAIVLGYIIGILGQGVSFCNLGSNPCPNARQLLAQQNSMVYGNAYWQLFTSIFVVGDQPGHFSGFEDAAFNAIAVLVLDFFLPDTFDNARYFAIFFGSAILGNLLTLVEGPLLQSAGASGGIFGVFAAAFAYNWAENKRIDMATLVLFLALFFGSGFLVLNVNWIAHLGGSIGGFISGPILYNSVTQSKTQYGISAHSSQKTKVIVLLAILFMFVGSAIQFLLFVS
jgi:rhomboid protease GluP